VNSWEPLLIINVKDNFNKGKTIMSQASMELEGAETIPFGSRIQENPKREVVEKTCNRCYITKSISEFYWNKNKHNYENDCKDCVKSRRKVFYIENYDKVRECNRKAVSRHQRRHPDKNTAKVSMRRARKIQATPNWLTKDQIQQINEVYRKAREITELTGELHVVDHIIPLKGENVCGLHVPWNLQVLPAIVNLKKGNQLMI
jgi:hypothetical protein